MHPDDGALRGSGPPRTARRHAPGIRACNLAPAGTPQLERGPRQPTQAAVAAIPGPPSRTTSLLRCCCGPVPGPSRAATTDRSLSRRTSERVCAPRPPLRASGGSPQTGGDAPTDQAEPPAAGPTRGCRYETLDGTGYGSGADVAPSVFCAWPFVSVASPTPRHSSAPPSYTRADQMGERNHRTAYRRVLRRVLPRVLRAPSRGFAP